MSQFKTIKYHCISYRIILLLSLLSFLSLSSVLLWIRPNQDTVIYYLVTFFLIEISLIAIYESTINLKISLNINLNRSSYILSDLLVIVFLSALNTLLLYIFVVVSNSINYLDYQLSISFYLLTLVSQIAINRIFYLFGFYLYKFVYFILGGIILLFIIQVSSLQLIIDLVNHYKITNLIYFFMIIFMISEVFLILKLKKINLIFKKSLSER